jgi:hypothetical protein
VWGWRDGWGKKRSENTEKRRGKEEEAILKLATLCI